MGVAVKLNVHSVGRTSKIGNAWEMLLFHLMVSNVRFMLTGVTTVQSAVIDSQVVWRLEGL